MTVNISEIGLSWMLIIVIFVITSIKFRFISPLLLMFVFIIPPIILTFVQLMSFKGDKIELKRNKSTRT